MNDYDAHAALMSSQDVLERTRRHMTESCVRLVAAQRRRTRNAFVLAFAMFPLAMVGGWHVVEVVRGWLT